VSDLHSGPADEEKPSLDFQYNLVGLNWAKGTISCLASWVGDETVLMPQRRTEEPDMRHGAGRATFKVVLITSSSFERSTRLGVLVAHSRGFVESRVLVL
jgi:hypothetical protein